MNIIKSTVFAIVMILGIGSSKGQDADNIQQVINKAYVEGIHNFGDLNDTRNGFHPDFQMFVLREEMVFAMSLDEWIQRIENGRNRNPVAPVEKASAKYLSIDVTGDAASVKLELHRGNRVLFTDYLFLYKLDDQWKIVSKAYHMH